MVEEVAIGQAEAFRAHSMVEEVAVVQAKARLS
jgi:hypothetical protein